MCVLFSSAIHLNGKTGRSGGTTYGTVLPTGNFSEKRNNLRRIPLFSFSPKWPGISLNHLTYHTYVPSSLVRYAVYLPKLLASRNICSIWFHNGTTGFFFPFKWKVLENCTVPCISWTILTGFSIKMESALGLWYLREKYIWNWQKEFAFVHVKWYVLWKSQNRVKVVGTFLFVVFNIHKIWTCTYFFFWLASL